jgi:Fibronectin type III domain
MGLTRVLGVVVCFALLHNPVRTLSAALPDSYRVVVAWDPSPSVDVSGYLLYYGAASGDYTNSVVVGKVTTNTVSGLAGGVTYFFAVTAYDASGQESDFSNEMRHTPGVPGVWIRVTPGRQVVLTVTGQIGHAYDILATEDFAAWTIIGTVTLDASGSMDSTDTNAANFPERFYRTRDTQP